MWRVALYSEPALDARTADRRLLTPGEVFRSERLVDPLDRHRFIVSHDLLRRAVADRLGTRPADTVLDFTCDRCGEQHGRPRVIGGVGSADVAVSLSRSAGVAVAAVLVAPRGLSAPLIGVDVERVDSVGFDGFDDVALSAAERAWLDSVLGGAEGAPRAGTIARAALWVRKEAVAKALGTGLRRDPREIEVLGDGAGRALIGGHAMAWFDVAPGSLEPAPGHAPGHAVAVAVAGIEVENVTIEVRSLRP